MNDIIIQAYSNRKLSKKTVDIGNMQENQVTKLIFELDKDIVALGGNVYLFVSYEGSTYPYPLTNNTFEVGRELTQRKKADANLVVSTSTDTDNVLDGVVWISNTLTLLVDKNSINIESINEGELPPSLKIVYDNLLNLEKDLQEKRDSDYWRGEPGPQGPPGEGGVDESQLLQFAIRKTTEESIFHYIKDGSNYRVLDMGVVGTSTRIGGESRNLLKYPYLTFTCYQSGLAFTDNKDGSFTLNGTVQGMTDVCIDTENTLEAGETYILDLGVSDEIYAMLDWAELRGFNRDEDVEFKKPFVAGASDFNGLHILILIPDGVVLDNVTFRPNLNKGTEVQPWSPYGVSDIKAEIVNAGTLNEETGRYEFVISLADGENTKLQEITLTSPVPISKWDKLVKRDSVYGWSIWSVLIESYNGEEVTDEYISTTNDLSIGASVQYKATEEVMFIPLLQEEQEMLKNIEIYYGETEISNDQNCPMWLEYVADTKLYVDNQILEMKKAII